MKTRISVILMLVIICLSPAYKCLAQDAEPNFVPLFGSIEVTEPNAPDSGLGDNRNLSAAEPNEPNNITTRGGDVFNKEFVPLLSQYINDKSMVDYGKLHRYRLDMKALLALLATLDPQEYQSWTRNEKTAFWINTYNVMMVSIIADNYPIESRRLDRLWWPPNSIRHIPPRGQVGVLKWNAYKFIIMDEEFTLSEIESRYFKKQFDDPRIFLALTLASLDSPPIKNTPYYGKDLDKQLDEQAKRFLSSPRAFKIDKERARVYLSVLFEPKPPWYGNEFLAKYGTDKKFKSQTPAIAAVLNFISNYVSRDDVDYLETGNYIVYFQTYDWRVNEQ